MALYVDPLNVSTKRRWSAGPPYSASPLYIAERLRSDPDWAALHELKLAKQPNEQKIQLTKPHSPPLPTNTALSRFQSFSRSKFRPSNRSICETASIKHTPRGSTGTVPDVTGALMFCPKMQSKRSSMPSTNSSRMAYPFTGANRAYSLMQIAWQMSGSSKSMGSVPFVRGASSP